MTLGELVLARVHAKRPRALALARTLVEVETPSTDPVAQGPALAWLGDRLAEVGFATWVVPGTRTGGHLYARPRHVRRPRRVQLVLGHVDTVWPIGTVALRPVELVEGTLRGPGVYDMKGGLVQLLIAVETLQELGRTPSLTPVVLVNSDEELGSHESTRHIRRLARVAERAFVLEPSLGRAGRLKTARKGVGRFTITIQGRAAHAGLDPEHGASAILELSHQIQRLFGLNDPTSGVSVNVGTIDGGLRPNVVAPQSRAVVDVRVPTREAALRVTAAIRALEPVDPHCTLKVEGGIGRPPMEPSPAGRRLWMLAYTLGNELGLELREATAGGGSDGNTTALYTPTLDGLGPVGGGAHADHEFLSVDQTLDRAALLALLLLAPPLEVVP